MCDLHRSRITNVTDIADISFAEMVHTLMISEGVGCRPSVRCQRTLVSASRHEAENDWVRSEIAADQKLTTYVLRPRRKRGQLLVFCIVQAVVEAAVMI